MKKLWKATVIAVMVALMGGCLSPHLQAQQRYLEDNFDYPVGDLKNQGGWLENRTATNNLAVEELAMSWENYATTTKAVRLPAASAAKLSKQFNIDLITTGSVYYSFLLRVHELAGSNYFIGLGQAGDGVTQVFGQVAVKKNTEDATKFHIGVGRAGAPNTTTEYSAEAYAMDDPLLVVVKYTFVDGEKNDEVLLYAAPALASEPASPTARNANANANDCPGMNAVMLYPAGSSFNKNADVSISALRVAPTWEGLFAATPDKPTPAFSVQYVDQGGQLPIYVMQYTQTKAHFTIKAENLTGDVTLVPPTQEGITFDKTTLSKEKLESSAGETLTVTLDAEKVNVNNQSAVIGFQTEGLENPYEYILQWLVLTVEKPASIAAMTATRIDESAYYALENLVVTYVDAADYETDGLYKYYAQDATGGILIEDAGIGAFFGRVYEVGDRLPLLIGSVSPSSMMATLSMTLANDPGEAVAKQVAVEPAVLTLAELQAEKSRYACVLIKIENAEFFNRTAEVTDEGMFAAAVRTYSIRQNQDQTTFKARTLNSTFKSTKVPLKAHLTGISTSAAGTVVSLRSPADITVVDAGTPIDPDPNPDPDPDPDDETIAGSNLFENAGFEIWDDPDDFNEEGKPTHWELNMGTAFQNTLDNYKTEGQKSLKIVTTGPLTNTLRQMISAQFIEGKKYRIRLPYYIATGSDDGKNLQLISYWQGPASVGEIEQDKNILNSGQYLTTKSGQWDTLEFITTAPASATAFYFAIRLNKNTTIYFDDFSFYRMEKVEDVKSRIFVDTKFLGTIKTFLGQMDSSASVSVNGELLTAPVHVAVAGTDAAYFRVGKTEIALESMPQTLKIYYEPKAAGFHHAELVFSSVGAETVRIPLNATGQDANAKPQLSILPETLEAFTVLKPGETQTKRLMISAMNMKDYVRAKVEGSDTGTFRLSNTMFLQNFENMPLDITYMPRRAGEHAMTLVIYSLQDRIERRIPLQGICSEDASTEWVETFERVATDLVYGDQYVNGEKGSWHLVDAVGAANENRDVFNGTRSIRLGNAEAKVEMDFDLMTGIDTLSFMVAACKDATESAKWRVETSSDFGLTWNAFGQEQSVGAAGVATTVVLEIKRAGVQRLRIVKTHGTEEAAAINIDDIRITSMPAANLKWEELAKLNKENPLDLLNESFTDKRHNKPLALEGWHNFIIKGDRPWWTYQQKDKETGETTEYMAKATAYNSLVDEAAPYEMWLITPALNGRKTGSKFFTFRVMGDLMLENQQGFLECYFIEPFADTMARSLIELNIPNIPDQNGEWFEYHLDMDLVEDLPEVFFIGFRFEGLGGRSNSTVYYIDDVTYGREDIAHITASVAELSFEAMAYKITESDEIEIKGVNLTEDIRVSVGGANPSCFTPSVDVLPKQGGKLKMGFISEQTGIHSAWIKLSSKGAPDLYIDMEVLVKPSVPTIVVAEENKSIVLNVKAPATLATSTPIIVNPFFLTEDIALTIEGDDADLFSLSRTSIPMDAYNETFTVTFTPNAQKPAGKCNIRLKSVGAEDVVIKVSGTSGDVANEDMQAFDVKVWRSTNAIFNVQAAGMREISIYAATGRIIYRDRQPADFKTFSLEKRPSGLYILEIRTADAVRRIRIVR